MARLILYPGNSCTCGKIVARLVKNGCWAELVSFKTQGTGVRFVWEKTVLLLFCLVDGSFYVYGSQEWARDSWHGAVMSLVINIGLVYNKFGRGLVSCHGTKLLRKVSDYLNGRKWVLVIIFSVFLGRYTQKKGTRATLANWTC